MNVLMRRTALGLLVLSAIGSAQAQSCVGLASADVAASENFNALASSGTSTVLPTGWALLETGTSANANGAYAASTGSSNAGDSYSFGAAGVAERALGGVLSGTLTPTFGACFRNDTGGDISALDIAYTGEQWRFGATGRSDRIDFQYSLDATALNTGAWLDVDALDFAAPIAATVGALDGNAAANRSALSTTLGALSIPAGATFWIRWTDFNASGADDGLAVDDVSVTARGAGISPPRLSIADAGADEGDGGTTPVFVTFSLNKPAGAGGVVIDYATADGSASAGSDYVAASGQATIAEGATSVTISVDVLGDSAIEPDESFSVGIVAATGADIDDAQATVTIRSDDFALTAIHDLQGNGLRSPLDGQFVTTTGIVTGRKNNGFFLQAPDAEADADPATSEGVFVFTGAAPAAGATVGSRVRVRGTVIEFVPASAPNQQPLTEIGGSPSVTVLSAGNALPAPVVLDPAMTTPGGGFAQLEAFEGMRVTAPSLTIVAGTDGFATGNNTGGSVNGILQAVLTGVARPLREAGYPVRGAIPGGDPAGTIPRWDENPETLTVDSDTLGGAAFLLDLPAGSVVEGLTGPLDYGFGRYTLHRDPNVAVNVASVAQIRAARAPVGDEITVASYNLERFFDTVNDGADGEPVLSAAQFELRLRKASLGIRDYLHAPDVLVTIEVETLAALQALAARINADAVAAGQPDPQYVAYLEEGNDVGGIDTGVLVKTAALADGRLRVEVVAVTQVGKGATYLSPDGSTDLLNDRPPLALDAIVHLADGRRFPLAVVGVHQRSLRGAEAATASGERIRVKRQRQAEFLADYLQQRQTDAPDTRLVVLGDFNAFEFNDGLVDAVNVVAGTPTPDAQTVVPGDGVDLVTPDLVNLGELAPASERYSFVFEGNAQTLDHVLVNEELVVNTLGAAIDHARINADFTETSRGNASVPTRTADHDPVIAYLSPRPRADLAVTTVASPASVRIGQTVRFDASVRNNGPEAALQPALGFAIDAAVPELAVAAPAGWTCDAPQVEAATTSVACSAATLALDAEAAFALTLPAGVALANRSVELVVASDAQSLDPVASNDRASAQVSVLADADLGVQLYGPSTLRSGTLGVFPMLVRNTGPDAAPDAVLELRGDAAAAGVRVFAPNGWSCAVTAPAAQQFLARCTAAQLAANGWAPFTLALLAPPHGDDGTLTVEARVSSAIADPRAGNNVDTQQTRLVGRR